MLQCIVRLMKVSLISTFSYPLGISQNFMSGDIPDLILSRDAQAEISKKLCLNKFLPIQFCGASLTCRLIAAERGAADNNATLFKK
jgi:hypothetical protein